MKKFLRSPRYPPIALRFSKKRSFFAKNWGVLFWLPRVARVCDRYVSGVDILVQLAELYKNMKTKF